MRELAYPLKNIFIGTKKIECNSSALIKFDAPYNERDSPKKFSIAIPEEYKIDHRVDKAAYLYLFYSVCHRVCLFPPSREYRGENYNTIYMKIEFRQGVINALKFHTKFLDGMKFKPGDKLASPQDQFCAVEFEVPHRQHSEFKRKFKDIGHSKEGGATFCDYPHKRLCQEMKDCLAFLGCKPEDEFFHVKDLGQSEKLQEQKSEQIKDEDKSQKRLIQRELVNNLHNDRIYSPDSLYQREGSKGHVDLDGANEDAAGSSGCIWMPSARIRTNRPTITPVPRVIRPSTVLPKPTYDFTPRPPVKRKLPYEEILPSKKSPIKSRSADGKMSPVDVKLLLETSDPTEDAQDDVPLAELLNPESPQIPSLEAVTISSESETEKAPSTSGYSSASRTTESDSFDDVVRTPRKEGLSLIVTPTNVTPAPTPIIGFSSVCSSPRSPAQGSVTLLPVSSALTSSFKTTIKLLTEDETTVRDEQKINLIKRSIETFSQKKICELFGACINRWKQCDAELLIKSNAYEQLKKDQERFEKEKENMKRDKRDLERENEHLKEKLEDLRNSRRSSGGKEKSHEYEMLKEENEELKDKLKEFQDEDIELLKMKLSAAEMMVKLYMPKDPTSPASFSRSPKKRNKKYYKNN